MKEFLISVLWLRCMTPVCPPPLPQLHTTYQGPPGPSLSSALKAAVVEDGWTCMSPAHHPHNWELGQRVPVALPGMQQRKTGRQRSHREGTCCIPAAAPLQPPATGVALGHGHQLLLRQPPGHCRLLPARDGNRYWDFVTTGTHPVTSHLSNLLSDKQGQIWPKSS